MARKQIDISETLFRPTPRLEHFRRTVGFLQAHHAHLVATGADRKELATLADTIDEMKRVIAAGEVFPLDTPQVEPEPEREEQPLCPEGAEQTIADIFQIALGDAA